MIPFSFGAVTGTPAASFSTFGSFSFFHQVWIFRFFSASVKHRTQIDGSILGESRACCAPTAACLVEKIAPHRTVSMNAICEKPSS
jgi:hypothetical protein